MSYNYTVKKGDTLNTIAQAHGFSNYKNAGVASVPSGNFDLIKEGETVNLGNYNPNEVRSFVSTPTVISSKDNQQQYVKDSGKVDKIAGAFDASILGKTPVTETPKTETKTTTEPASTSGDPVYDALQKGVKEQDAKLEAERVAKKQEYESLYQTSLSAIDATAQATINSINTSYDKRINEQNRINKLNIDRTKAYGLANGGQYTPMDFGDAITGKELEASDKISALENERTSLISQAKSARDAGQSKLLRDKLNDLNKIDEDLRTQLKAVADESEKRYKVLRDIRLDEEKKAKERQVASLKRVSDLAPSFKEDYAKMSPEQKDTFIKQIATQTGLDYASIYSTVESSLLKNATDVATLDQKKATIANTWKNVNKPVTTKTTTTPAGFKGTIPDTFTGADDYNAKRAEFVRLNGTKGASHWDAVFPKDPITKDPTFTVSKTPAPTITPEKKKSVFNAKTMFASSTPSGIKYNIIK